MKVELMLENLVAGVEHLFEFAAMNHSVFGFAVANDEAV